MYAEVALLLEEAADGAGHAADAELDGGAVRYALHDVAGDLHFGLAGLRAGQDGQVLLRLHQPGDALGGYHGPLAVDIGHLPVDLHDDGVVVVEHVPAHGRGAEGDEPVFVRLGAGHQQHVAAVRPAAVARGLREVYGLIGEVGAVGDERPLDGAEKEALDVEVAVELRHSHPVRLESRAEIELHALEITSSIIGEGVQQLIRHACGNAGGEPVPAFYFPHRLVHAYEL